MATYLVEYSGIFECEADSAEGATKAFEVSANALMGAGAVSYRRAETDAEYEDRIAQTPPTGTAN